MHMADALISPAVGGAMWAATAGLTAYSVKKNQSDIDEHKVPLMGVMGAFIFAAQMINFTIPATGSSGHLGGGLLLAAILGPTAGFLTMASILLIQALFFADGGLLALGCNIFNLGFFACFLAYPLIFRPIIKKKVTTGRLFAASLLAAVVALQLGAFSVVLETVLSGKTELPFQTFTLLMQPIHLAIGVVEGLITFAVVSFIYQARPEIIERAALGRALAGVPVKKVLAGLAIAAVVTGGCLSWFASANPDGLEWSLFRTTGTEELESQTGIHKTMAALQEKIALLPDYGFKEQTGAEAVESEEVWPAPSGGTSVSGLVGGLLTLILAGLAGLFVKSVKKRRKIEVAEEPPSV